MTILQADQKSETHTADRLAAGFEKCRRITQKYGTSFYFATQFFPKETRDGIYAIYAFARIPDEIVDNPNKPDRNKALAEMREWRQRWLEAMSTGRGDDDVMHAIVFAFNKYQIPVEYGEAFLKSMFQDEDKSSYRNYAELEDYMYGSAGVIGLMVTRVVGYSSEAAFPYAEKLGYAFQMTNFLRDMREDCDDLGRVYMPEDEMRRFGLDRRDIFTHVADVRFARFMKFQIERTREIYREALPGIKLLNWRGRLAVRISYVLYKAILNEIERANYNVYAGRVRTNIGQKVRLSLQAVA
ncbi:MAG: phytoene/squalene synthase family protein, partial [Pyrinomonadaceae bacterium]